MTIDYRDLMIEGFTEDEAQYMLRERSRILFPKKPEDAITPFRYKEFVILIADELSIPYREAVDAMPDLHYWDGDQIVEELGEAKDYGIPFSKERFDFLMENLFEELGGFDSVKELINNFQTELTTQSVKEMLVETYQLNKDLCMVTA